MLRHGTLACGLSCGVARQPVSMHNDHCVSRCSYTHGPAGTTEATCIGPSDFNVAKWSPSVDVGCLLNLRLGSATPAAIAQHLPRNFWFR